MIASAGRASPAEAPDDFHRGATEVAGMQWAQPPHQMVAGASLAEVIERQNLARFWVHHHLAGPRSATS